VRYNVEKIGMRIQFSRKQSGMTQEQLAEQLNIATSTLGKLERGKQGTSLELISEIALVLGISLDFLVFGYELDHNKIKTALRKMADELLDLEKKL